MTRKMNELKPCPFCGGKAILKKGFPKTQGKDWSQRLVQCSDCGCRTVLFKQAPFEAWQNNEQACIDAWNRRVEEIPNKFISISWLEEKLENHQEIPYAVTDGIINILYLWEQENKNAWI